MFFDMSFGDCVLFFILLEFVDGFYWGGVVVDLVGLNIDVEFVVISVLLYFGDLDDVGFEMVKDCYEFVLGSSIFDIFYVVFFNYFNGFDEVYVFCEVWLC